MLDTADITVLRDEPVGRLPRVWTVIALVSLAVGFGLTFDPSFGDLRSTVITLIPFVLLPTIVVALTQLPARGPGRALTVAAAGSVGAWTVLVLDDERWVVLTFALYGLCFSVGRVTGLVLAAAVTLVWTVAWIVDDGPAWRLTIPVATYLVAVVFWLTLSRAGAESTELADALQRLTVAQHDLAVAEREKGVLEERARVAAEIHDTLAQGFTSIVLTSRAARRAGEGGEHLDQIEAVAAENLDAARRLVAAIGPSALDSSTLPEAIARHVAGISSDALTVEFDVVGEPRAIDRSIEVALWRAVQEALVNVRRHAEATRVHVTLTYLADLVTLDVRDDGVGIDALRDRAHAELSGGQGLDALRRRVEALGGRLDVESGDDAGTTVSVHVPGPTT